MTNPGPNDVETRNLQELEFIRATLREMYNIIGVLEKRLVTLKNRLKK